MSNGAEKTTGSLGALSSNGGSAGNLEGKAGTREGDPIVLCGDPVVSIWEPEPEGGLRPCTVRGGEESFGDPATGCRVTKLGGVAARGGVDTTVWDGSVAGPGADREETTGAMEAPVVDAFPKGDVETAAGDPEGCEDMERGDAFRASSLCEMSGHWAADCSAC